MAGARWTYPGEGGGCTTAPLHCASGFWAIHISCVTQLWMFNGCFLKVRLKHTFTFLFMSCISSIVSGLWKHDNFSLLRLLHTKEKILNHVNAVKGITSFKHKQKYTSNTYINGLIYHIKKGSARYTTVSLFEAGYFYYIKQREGSRGSPLI